MSKKKSWKTTVFGTIAAIGMWTQGNGAVKATKVEPYVNLATAIALIFTGAAAQDSGAVKESAKKETTAE